MRQSLCLLGVVGVVLCLTNGAAAQWSDNFESYPLGEICGEGGWEVWTPGEGTCGTVSDEEANGGEKSLKIEGRDVPP